MPYALNINKGTTIQHPDIGILEAGIAIYIPKEKVDMADSLKGVIVFDKVAGVKDTRVENEMAKLVIEEKITYQDFVKKYKDFETATARWNEYKISKGIKE